MGPCNSIMRGGGCKLGGAAEIKGQQIDKWSEMAGDIQLYKVNYCMRK